MAKAELRNAPRLEGWAIAAGAGVVAFGAAYVAAGVNAPGSVAIGVVLLLVVGLILGLPSASEAPPAAAAAAPQPRPAPKAEAVVAPAATIHAAPPVTAPAPAAPVARPQGLAAPRSGAPDDLKIIKGIGPKLEQMLHGMGYYHFDQIAAWTEAEIAWVDDNLEGFKGRVTRDEWVAQARALATGAH